MGERDVQRFSIYLPRQIHEELRTIAFQERTSINKLVVAALQAALAKRATGKPKTTKKGA